MEKRDYRSASAEERAASRRAAIKLIKAGQRKGKVAECFGVSANTITNWLKRYDNEGVQSFRDKPRGVKSEDKKLLSDSQEREIEALTSGLLGIFEPVLILAMGGIVLIIVLAILLPIFDMNQLVR